ncbi:Uncharacterised protein g10959 [Pycnogonum litorale]
MWYEILPSAAIICACLAAPTVTTYISHMIFLKRPFRRSMVYLFDEYEFLRDKRITGNGHRQQYLESIPDVPVTSNP